MANKRFNFTKKAIQALPASEKGIITYHDTSNNSLKLLVRLSGIKTFVVYRKIKGRPERIKIGRFPEVTVEQARKQTDIINAKIAQGINPNEEKRAIRGEMTLKQLFNDYLDRHAKKHKKSWKEDENQFDRYLSGWANKKLSSIRKQQIQKLHSDITKEHGSYAANRLLSLLHGLFNKANDWGWSNPNPAHGIKKNKEKSRERFLEADELPRFFKALAEEPNETARDYFIISLLTGARRSNVLAMRWEEINFERATWTIPMTKNGESHTVPLVPEVVTILKKRRKDLIPWVFPGNGKSGHYADPKKAWKRILERAELKDLRTHDLRRSLGSWQAATGANLSIIGKTLAHKNITTTAVYARLNIDPVRASMNKATQAMLDASAQPINGDKIVNLEGNNNG